MGEHLMLIDLKQPLKEGDLIKLTLTFEKAGEVKVDVMVVDRLAGDAATHMHTQTDSN
jgi:copper(I)-binding protein